MSQNHKSFIIRINPKILGIFVFSFFSILSIFITERIYEIEKKREFLQVEHEAILFKKQLESSLNHSITATKVISFFAKKFISSEEFAKISKELLAQNPFIDAIQLVEGSTIIHTYPLTGNEITIGYDIRNEDIHINEAMKAKSRQELYFEGPFELIQGGIGIVGRFPIYRNEKFWGFSAVVLRAKTFLSAFGIDPKGKNSNFVYELTKRGEDGSDIGKFFNHDPNYNKGIFHKEEVSLGDWNLYVKARSPKHLVRSLPYGVLGVILSVVLGILSYRMSNEPQRLQSLVDQKTAELNLLNESLKQKARDLEITNSEMEQFAYIASHDLQEPLRMVTSFLTQLEKKYSESLDEKAKLYIYYAVDGAKRMRQIILDLLDFSRVGKFDEEKEAIDLRRIIDQVSFILRKSIEEKSAEINIISIPESIFCHKTPIEQIFQNLLSNALKYSATERTPVIEISCTELEDFWEFSIKDNGIGIDEDAFDRIFIIFQRLHAKDEYGGTGMGLSIVKKIVENLGGRIWVKSNKGEGSTFYFTIRK
ncbi:ATP-binding protein [Leptospira sp. GIMC2001]|uniref:ATP-binding protein n=1 Tax=Leptospira sp. GIMC2001 TaxID=1513297 RepID=UPI00234B6A6D|nr:ATP-binding protein [Leptospira sp. GIMC2001]WCL48806.1 ATP-binding protein [Leptospira sp. GIMC2001]